MTDRKKRGKSTKLFLAKQYSKILPNSLFVAVTGSVGKTLAVLACQSVSSEKFPTISTYSDNLTLDSFSAFASTILKVRPNVKKVILEMGVYSPGEMDVYLGLVKPSTVIVTRIDYQNNQSFEDLKDISQEQSKLVEQLPKSGNLIINWDDLNARALAEKTQAEVIYFGTDQKNCHVWAGNLKLENFRVTFQLNYGVERVEIKSQLLGFHQVYPLLAAASLGVSMGIPMTSIKRALERVAPLEHRLQALPGFNGSVVLDDTYNGVPVAVEEAIETLSQVPARRRIAVLGEMKHLGSLSEKLHRRVAGALYKNKIDLVLTGGGDAELIADELLKLGFIPERLYNNLQNPQLANKLMKIIARGDVILVKASNETRFKEIVQRISKKRIK